MASRSSGSNYVNLDALIPRADLFEHSTSVANAKSIKITDLKPGLVYSLLRKPDFQRETANWTPEQVARLIETFAGSDIIPAIILWQNGNRVFVVDGAHRLSALIAWVRNDYGAGELSIEFSRGAISDHQRALHDQTLELIAKGVGPWSDHEKRGTILGMKDIEVQWIDNQSSAKAADAFIRINQGGTVIDSLEVRILRAKRSALAIATRLIAHGGTGHEYWKHFEEPYNERAQKLGEEIHKLLFRPALEMPVKTLDVPLAGVGYGVQVTRFAFDLVALANNLPVPDSTRKKTPEENLPDDEKGAETVQYLQKTKKALQLILSNDPSSLGLHPALYFYTAGGAFQPAALQNAVVWLLDLQKRGKLDQFKKIRKSFETLILAHPIIVKPAAHKLGSGGRTRSRMVSLFEQLFDILSDDPNPEKAWRKLKRRDEFKFLATDEKEQKEDDSLGKSSGKFSRATKSAAYLVENLPSAPKCVLCGGFMHRNGMVADHRDERSKGGSSSRENARMVHPICNSNRGKSNEPKAGKGRRVLQPAGD
jgi:5-methylcytosine-specific restriction endonuclease McrA